MEGNSNGARSLPTIWRVFSMTFAVRAASFVRHLHSAFKEVEVLSVYAGICAGREATHRGGRRVPLRVADYNVRSARITRRV